jgi:regulator of protease activity HflC (stomatin/prohibitin superfamily)
VSVVAIILLVIAVIVLAGGIIGRSGIAIGISVLVGIVGVVLFIISATYAVGPGEAKVLKSWTGTVNPEEVATPGFYGKSPFEDAIDFDVRNQLAVFLGNGEQQYNGAPTNGPQITFTDKDGVTGNMDLVILYSIKPDAVVGLVENYQNQEDFKIKVIEQDARSVPRDVPGKYTTIQMLTDRVAVAGDIKKALEAEWKDKGIVIEDVSLQEIRYSDAVKARFEEAQNAQTEVVKAQAEAEKKQIEAKAQAEAAITKAQGEAEANTLLTKSLTPQVLQQRYLDVLAGANLIVVPQGFTALGQIPTGAQ